MDKQKEVLKYLSTVETATIDEIYKNVSFSYYANYQKYIGEIMSRMVKNGTATRIKKGLFCICRTSKFTDIDKSQISMF